MDRYPKRAEYEDSLSCSHCGDCGRDVPSYKTGRVVYLLLFGLILSLELVNTAVEAVVDLVTEEKKPLAKIAKDTAAGAVLVSAIAAAIIGCIIFIPYLLELMEL